MKIKFCVFFVMLIVTTIVACQPDPKQSSGTSELKVEIWAQGQQLDCELMLAGEHWQLQQVAWFVSELRFDGQSESYNTVLPDNDWQSHNVALIKPCGMKRFTKLVYHRRNGSSAMAAQKERLAFTLGLPFELNHLNPIVQSAPLNKPDMFWSWQMGYKFLRLDMASNENAWAFHLGSTGCVSSSGVRPPERPCVSPNRLSFELNKHADGKVLRFYVDRLLEGIQPEAASRCIMHGANEPQCDVLISNLARNQVFEWW